MTFIEDIRARLKKYPGVVVEESKGRLTVKAQDASGFDVSIRESAGNFIIGFAGWHDDFADPGDAHAWIAFGLSEKCRLRVHRKGGKDYRWAVEEHEKAGWSKRSEVGLLVYPVWSSRKERFLQNHLLKYPAGAQESC